MPSLTPRSCVTRLPEAKERAARRQAAEMEIPAHLLYEAGWPVCMPTALEARHLASVRRRAAEAAGISADCLDGDAVSGRYAALMSEFDQRRAT